jgi:hypothetical protein
MSVTIQRLNKSHLPQNFASANKRKKAGHTRPRRLEIGLDQDGRVRVANLLAILNVSHSTLYAGLKSGRYPLPDGYDGSMPFWNTSTIRTILES